MRNVLEKIQGSATVIATRGTCTYTTKAKHAQEASAGALLIVNNVEGLVHPPGPDAKDFGKGQNIIVTMHVRSYSATHTRAPEVPDHVFFPSFE